MNETDDSILQAETTVTDITIGADGRIFVFGTSRQVIELLADFQPGNPRLEALLGCLRHADHVDRKNIRPDF
jgi:hypothetical protein